MSADPVRQVADAVLYEGYVLWPYRRSALKNRRRFTFGGVYPRGHSEGRVDDPWQMRTECLVLGDAPDVNVGVRFLHVVHRQAARAVAGRLQEVDELVVDGERHLTWEEAVEREVAGERLPVAALARAPRRLAIRVAAGREREDLRDAEGGTAGAVVRTWRALEGSVDVRAVRLRAGVHRLSVTISNTTAWPGGTREQLVERTLCSTHTALAVRGGELASLTDPPAALAGAARECRNEGTWPVLVGEPGSRDRMLSSPIILEDYPRVAPESPGDLFDGAEIDGLLTLSILSLTEAEQEEMRATDPRAREILERTAALSRDELMGLHGAIRELRRRDA